MSLLFSPITFRGVTLRNRVVVSPMCEYSSRDGLANDWHFVHLGSRAVGGAGLILTEAAAVTADGRISAADLGIYSDDHVEPLARIFRFLETHGAVPGMQLAHAGRKASTAEPWKGGGPVAPDDGGWTPIWAPSALPFRDGWQAPRAMDTREIGAVVRAFAAAAARVLAAGGKVIEIHAAHGYLIHEFLSPLSNLRTDEYGGSFDNRARFLFEVADAVRGVWPERLPLFVRISATDWTDGGWTIDDSAALAARLKPRGVDLIDCSSGGNVAHAKIALGPGYQVPFAERVRRDAGMPTGAVGLITEPAQAEAILGAGQADLIIMARQLLRDPYWPLHAAQALGETGDVPVQYLRAF
ncbi:MAG TPA: NADH:flavin oxidoreductase/NADH oxidase [Vicinamibacterales bacterium]|jgi:2,4-dienoyl-CoA reductase-like NADH-dependent reductase (Old Yellow Enzyme family)|nr:NADH:flavin oxidoreductase/NADH oxidase [Vicinamibacterales bacterium]